MIKQTITGYVGKGENLRKCFCVPREGLVEFTTAFFKRRGREEEWDADDWPPCKVRITVEEVE